MRRAAVAILIGPDAPADQADIAKRAAERIGAGSIRMFRDARELASSPASDFLIVMHPTWVIFDVMCRGVIVVTNQKNRYLWHLNNCVRVLGTEDDIADAMQQVMQNKHLASILTRQAKTIFRRCDRKQFNGGFLPRSPGRRLPGPVELAEEAALPQQKRPVAEDRCRTPAAPNVSSRPLVSVLSRPLVSVIMPCYNDEDVVMDAIDSVLSQTWEAIELIIVDDGSEDNTRGILSSVSDRRTVVGYKRNGGPSSARNMGLRMVGEQAEYVAFLDSDDRWEATFIEKAVGLLEAAKASTGLAYCNSRLTIDGEFSEFMRPEYSWPKLISGWGMIPTGAFVVRRAVVDVVGEFDDEIERGEDLEWMWRVGLFFNFVHADETLHHYRRSSSGQLTTSAVNIGLLDRKRAEYLQIRPSEAPLAKPGRPHDARSRRVVGATTRKERGKGRVAILYVTHNRLACSRLTLPHLLESGGYSDYSVFVVDNASTDGTQQWLMSLRHPRLGGIAFNKDNRPLYEVTNRFWSERQEDAEFLGKVDNDTLMPTGFIGRVVKTAMNPVRLGAMGAMHFDPLDAMSVDASLYASNIRHLPNGMEVVLQRHLGGCCYIIRSGVTARLGPLEDVGYIKGGWTEYQWKCAKEGYPSAYLYPFMFAKHFDDPSFRLSVSAMGGELPDKLPPPALFRKSEMRQAASLLGHKVNRALLAKYRSGR